MKNEKTWGLALAALAVVSGFGVWYLDILSKRLSFTLVSTTSLSSQDLAAFRGVKLSVADIAVIKPQLAILKLANTGLKEVRTGDFEAPITISLSSPGQIVATAPSGSSREQVQAVITTNKGKAEISPLLLNRGDAVSVALLVDGDPPQFRVAARIAGVPELAVDLIDPQQKKDAGKLASKFMVLLTSFLLFLYFFVFLDMRAPGLPPSESLVFPPKSRFYAALVLGVGAVGPLIVVLDEFDMSIGNHSFVNGTWVLAVAALAGALVVLRRMSFGTHPLEPMDQAAPRPRNEA